MTILIVDNLIAQLVAMKKAIQRVVPEDCEFTEADNLESAVAIIEGDHPIGLDVIRTIRRQSHREDTRAILITAYPGEQSKAMASEVGADRFISKLEGEVTEMLQSMVKELLGI